MKTSFEQSTYMKIYHMIANDITAGIYKAGDIIPTQVELAKKYDVSRATISEAIKELTRRKIVKTQRGKGTFVIVHPLEIGNFKRFDGFSSFRSKHRDRNLTSKAIDVSLIDIPEEISKRLHAPQNAKVWRVCRVRYVDGVPMSHETSFLLQSYLNGIDLAAEDLEHGSLYSVLRMKAGLEFSYSEDRVLAQYCPADIAQHLQISQNEPALMINRICGIDEEHLVEYINIVERSDISYTIFQSSRGTSERHTDIPGLRYPLSGRKIREGLFGASLGATLYSGADDSAALSLQEQFLRSCFERGSADGVAATALSLCRGEESAETLLYTVLPLAFLIKDSRELQPLIQELFSAYGCTRSDTEAATAFMLALQMAVTRSDLEESIVLDALRLANGTDEVSLSRRVEFACRRLRGEEIDSAIEHYFSVIGARKKLSTTIPLLFGIFICGGNDYLNTLKQSAPALENNLLSGLLGALVGTFYTRAAFPDEEIRRIKDGGSKLDGFAARMEILRESF